MNTRSPAFVAAAITIGLGWIMMSMVAINPVAALFFVPFSFGPQFVTGLLAARLSGRTTQRILLAAALLYFGWFGFAFCDLFYWHPDPQNGIGLLFVSVYSLPVLGLLWVAAVKCQRRAGA